MTISNPSNFFENAQGLAPEPVTPILSVPVPSSFVEPDVLSSYNTNILPADVYNIDLGINSVLSLLNGSAPDNFNAQQIQACENVLSYLTVFPSPLWADFATDFNTPAPWSNVFYAQVVTSPEIIDGVSSLWGIGGNAEASPPVNFTGAYTNTGINFANTTVTFYAYIPNTGNFVELWFGCDSVGRGLNCRIEGRPVQNSGFDGPTGSWYNPPGLGYEFIGQPVTTGVWHTCQISTDTTGSNVTLYIDGVINQQSNFALSAYSINNNANTFLSINSYGEGTGGGYSPWTGGGGYFSQISISAGANNLGNVTITHQQALDIVIANEAINKAANTGFPVAIGGPTAAPIPFGNPGPFTCVVTDQFFLIEQPNTGNFYVSNADDGTTWQALSFAASESYSDQLLAVDYLNGYVMLMGNHSTEYWSDQGAGITPFPFARVQGAAQTWGLLARSSRAKFMNGEVWLGQSFNGAAQVLFLLGGTFVPTVISTPDIEEIINTFNIKNDAVGSSYVYGGHAFFELTFPSARRTFLYDATSSAQAGMPMWSELQSGCDEYNRHGTSYSGLFQGTCVATDWSNGNLYALDPLNPTDNGYIVKREMYTMHLHNDGNLFAVPQLYLDMDVGGGGPGYSANAVIAMSYSKDQGKTFSTPDPRPLGNSGDYLNRVTWRQLGQAFDMVFRFNMAAPVPFAIVNGGANILSSG